MGLRHAESIILFGWGVHTSHKENSNIMVCSPDWIIWVGEKLGQFSVKSVYNMDYEQRFNQNN